MTKTRQPPLQRSAQESAHDRRTELVRDMMEKESAAQDAKTARLKALRLAREAEEQAAAPAPAPVPAKAKAKRTRR